VSKAATLSAAIGDGLVAGAIGTAAMTASSTIEARLRGRAFSTAPARATAKALGIREFDDDVARARFNDLSHWGYGTGWGVARGLLGAVGLRSSRATAAHGAAVWGSAAVALPALDVAPPFVFWGKEEVGIDLLHHAVYAIATGVAYEALAVGRRRNGAAGA
jgi:hypothetical protein